MINYIAIRKRSRKAVKRIKGGGTPPNKIAGLVRWYATDFGVTVASGDVVDSWLDKSGSGVSMDNSLIYRAYNQWQSDTIGGRRTIGADLGRFLAKSSTTVLNGASGYTLITVHRYRDTRLAPNAPLVEGGVYGITGKRMMIGAYKSGSNWIARAWYRRNTSATTLTIDGPVLAFGDVMISVLRVNFQSPSPSAYFEVNDVVYAGTAPTTGTMTVSGSSAELIAYADTVNIVLFPYQAIPSDIGEIILFNRPLESTEVESVKDYLKSRFSLSYSAPPAPVYSPSLDYSDARNSFYRAMGL